MKFIKSLHYITFIVFVCICSSSFTFGQSMGCQSNDLGGDFIRVSEYLEKQDDSLLVDKSSGSQSPSGYGCTGGFSTKNSTFNVTNTDGDKVGTITIVGDGTIFLNITTNNPPTENALLSSRKNTGLTYVYLSIYILCGVFILYFIKKYRNTILRRCHSIYTSIISNSGYDRLKPDTKNSLQHASSSTHEPSIVSSNLPLLLLGSIYVTMYLVYFLGRPTRTRHVLLIDIFPSLGWILVFGYLLKYNNSTKVQDPTDQGVKESKLLTRWIIITLLFIIYPILGLFAEDGFGVVLVVYIIYFILLGMLVFIDYSRNNKSSTNLKQKSDHQTSSEDPEQVIAIRGVSLLKGLRIFLICLVVGIVGSIVIQEQTRQPKETVRETMQRSQWGPDGVGRVVPAGESQIGSTDSLREDKQVVTSQQVKKSNNQVTQTERYTYIYRSGGSSTKQYYDRIYNDDGKYHYTVAGKKGGTILIPTNRVMISFKDTISHDEVIRLLQNEGFDMIQQKDNPTYTRYDILLPENYDKGDALEVSVNLFEKYEDYIKRIEPDFMMLGNFW